MKKGRVLSFNKIKFFKNFKKDRLRILFIALFFIGFLIGVFSFSKNTNIYFFIKKMYDSFYNILKCNNHLKVFFSFYFISGLFLLIVLFFGLSLIGIAIIPCIFMLSGYIFGEILIFNYQTDAIKGIVLNALIVVPYVFVIFALTLYFSKFMFDFSLLLSKISIKNIKLQYASNTFSALIKKFILIIALLLPFAFIFMFYAKYLLSVMLL